MREVMRALALWACVLLAPAGATALDDARLAAAMQAGEAFVALAAKAPEGRKPRESDPAVAKLLGTVFDRDIFGRGRVPVTEAGKLGLLLRNANRVGLVYYLDGTGAADLAGMKPDLVPRADRNVAVYAPEIGAWLDYQIAIQNGLVGGTLDFLARATPDVLSRPNVRSGLDDVRQGMTRSISGLLRTLLLDGLTDDWRVARLNMLLEGVDGAAAVATPDLRQSMRELARQVAREMPDATVKAKLDEFVRRVDPGPR
jgi:hypothetical protein